MRQLNVRLEPSATFETWNSDNKPWPFGTRGHAPDGRTFRMAQAGGTALTVGRTAQAALTDVRLRNRGFVVPTTERRDNVLVLALGDVNLDNGAFPAGEFDEGLLYVVSGTGAGHVFRIARSAEGDASDNTLTVTVDTGPTKSQTKLMGFSAETTRATLLKNRFKGLTITDTPPKTAVVGISPVAVTANYYFWAQTHGACAVLQDGVLEDYRPIAASRIVQGAVSLATVTVPDPDAVEGMLDTDSVAVINEIDPTDRGVTRIAPVSGVGVVPGIPLGYVLDEGYDGAHALVHLAVEA